MASLTVETDPESVAPGLTEADDAATTRAVKEPTQKKATAQKKTVTKKRITAKKMPAKKVAPAKKAKSKKAQSTKATANGKPKSKRTFPHRSLEEAKRVPDALRQYNSGNAWAPSEVAGALGLGLSSNYFYLTAASRDYGFTLGTRDSERIELTPVGRTLVYPKSPQEAKDALVAGFRNVELFKKVYDYYQGENLPDIQYLKNTLKTEFGVDEEHQDEFYALYQKNLTYLRAQGAEPVVTAGSGVALSGSPNSIILGESKNAGALVAFVAMPFSERSKDHAPGYFDEVLKHLITPAAVNANFNARTAKKAGSEVIQSTIVNDLDNADLVIVDLTEHNPNVLFELGMRIAFGKPVCLIRAKGTAPIFDIDHMLRVFDYNPSLWASTLAADVPALSEFIKETWNNREKERSYLKILRETKT